MGSTPTTLRSVDALVADGRKIVYWQKNAEGKWLITGETFGTKRFEPMQYSLSQPLVLQEEKKETRE